MDNRIVIGLTGLPGSGKTEVAKILKKAGFKIFSMGDVVREEVKKRGLELKRENLEKIAIEIREKEGKDAVAKRIIEKVKNTNYEKICIDGIRSIDEINTFKKVFKDFKLIAVICSKEERMTRLRKRARSDDDLKKLEEREKHEKLLGIDKAIEIADIKILNEGSLEDLREKVEEILSNFR